MLGTLFFFTFLSVVLHKWFHYHPIWIVALLRCRDWSITVLCCSIVTHYYVKSIQDQYKLVHLVLLECLVAEPSSIACDGNLEKYIKELRESGALQRQFNHMHELRWQDQALRSASAQISNSPVQKSKSKNRSQGILPGKNCHLCKAIRHALFWNT
jgi:hypothetical protein